MTDHLDENQTYWGSAISANGLPGLYFDPRIVNWPLHTINHVDYRAYSQEVFSAIGDFWTVGQRKQAVTLNPVQGTKKKPAAVKRKGKKMTYQEMAGLTTSTIASTTALEWMDSTSITLEDNI